jgi:Rhs element Vgr protein
MSELFIPNPSRHDVSTFNILVAEKAIDPSYQILSISIIKEINRVPSAKIVLRDGEASEKDFEISNKEDFVPGKKIKIKIGFDGTNAQAFQGIIVKHAIKIRENGNTELHIECQDEAVRMTIGRKSKYFEKIKDSRLFDELIGTYKGLKSEPESTTLEHKELVQHHISDWDFLLLRAEANGMLVNVNDGTIQIGKPKTSAKPVLQVTYGSSVLELEAEIDARKQWKNVKAISWDYANQKLFEADASEASSFKQHGDLAGDELAKTIDLDKYQLHHSGQVLEQELKDWTEGVMMRSRLSKIRGRTKVTGFSGIKPGDMIKLEGIGNRFKGNAFVTSVKHEIGGGMWDTHIQFGLDSNGYAIGHSDLNDAPSAGLIGAIQGLQIGKVVQLQNDPDGEHRILVKIPVIDDQGQGIWTRVASLDAGSDRGAFFRPEIDDEVIVGFINDDPRDAVVLGMLHSSAKGAPITAQDVNHEKGFTTRSKMHIHFNDNTKTITIDTPAGNKIVLDESATKIEIKDQSNNKITMEPQGIKMESPVNIDIKAGAVLTLSAGASLSIGAPSLSIKADASVSIEGATAKFSSQGPNIIKGLPVMIN